MVRLSEGPGVLGLDEALSLLATPCRGSGEPVLYWEDGEQSTSDSHDGKQSTSDSHDGKQSTGDSHDGEQSTGNSHPPESQPGCRLHADRSHGLATGLDFRGLAPRRYPVVVSFDDGTADFVEVTVPILVRHGVPAILYLATAFIEEGHPFPDNGRPSSWSGLREALSTGLVQIGSHSHNHLLFDRVSTATAADDLDRSIGLIGDRLGVEARHFAYPKALRASGAVEVEVRTRFASAAVAGTAPNRFGATDPHRLSRSPVQVHDGLRFFELKARGGLRLEDTVRRLTSRRRYAGATT